MLLLRLLGCLFGVSVMSLFADWIADVVVGLAPIDLRVRFVNIVVCCVRCLDFMSGFLWWLLACFAGCLLCIFVFLLPVVGFCFVCYRCFCCGVLLCYYVVWLVVVFFRLVFVLFGGFCLFCGFDYILLLVGWFVVWSFGCLP